MVLWPLQGLASALSPTRTRGDSNHLHLAGTRGHPPLCPPNAKHQGAYMHSGTSSATRQPLGTARAGAR